MAKGREEFEEPVDPETGEIGADGLTPRQRIVAHAQTIAGGHPYQQAKIPREPDFGDDDFISAPDLETLAEKIMGEHALDAFDAQILFRWKKKGGSSGQRDVWGKCQAISGIARHLAKREFLIWLAADHCRENRLTNYQLEALLHHELMHIEAVADDSGQIQMKIRGHDWEGFFADLERYGKWHPIADQRMNEAWQQAKLIPEGWI